MPEVRVQLSDEQVEWLRKLEHRPRPNEAIIGTGDAFVKKDVLEACADAVREQLPPPIKVGDKVRTEHGLFVWDVVAVDLKSAWLRRVGDEGVRRMDCLVELLVRVEDSHE